MLDYMVSMAMLDALERRAAMRPAGPLPESDGEVPEARRWTVPGWLRPAAPVSRCPSAQSGAAASDPCHAGSSGPKR